LRAARGLVGISQSELCQLTGLGISTIFHFEREHRIPKAGVRALLRATLEQAGVVFIEEDGSGVGVKLATIAGGK
jgi:transcriptional regulator with XRE-family HTH domain